MRVIGLSFLLWAGITYGSTIMPYSLNLLSSGLTYPPRLYDYPFPSRQVLQRLPPIREKHLNDSLRFGQASVDALKRLEDNLKNSGVSVELGSSEHGQLISGYPSDEALILQKLSWTVTKASLHISHMYCGRYGVSDDECASYVSTFSLKNTIMGQKCMSFIHPRCVEKKYRTYDGSCNNLVRGSWGQSLSGFKRLLHPKYADGIDQPRQSSLNKPLPPARTISSTLAKDVNVPDAKHSIAVMQWSEFIEHDLVQVPIRKMVHSDNTINCCDRWGSALSPRHQHPSCAAMTVSKKDPFYGPHWISCLSYTKSVTTFRSDCTFGAAEQMNQATHFMDGSHIYGTNLKKASSLRQHTGGLMKITDAQSGIFLPSIEQSKKREMCQVLSDDEVCFKSGDSRVNSHPYLTSMHVLWLREHNRIAKKLAELNPTWSDELLYQETRKIVIAKLQHISYSHWLPLLIGNNYENFQSHDTGYGIDLDPSITNSVGTAGLRFFNSLLDGAIHLVNEDRTLNSTLDMSEHFNRPDIIMKDDNFSHLVRGMITQAGQSLDLHLSDDITEKLFSAKNSKYGLDVLSFDIQRSRDHGIPGYNQYRSLCGLKSAVEFDDFNDVISENVIKQLKEIYTNVQDVDLIIGALAEKASDGSLLGPTFSCLLSEQLIRTRNGDRYFYTNVEQTEPFTEQQLMQIKKTSLARIICDNIPEIKEIQKDVFSLISQSNPLMSCGSNDIKRVNLVAWQDPSHKPDLITRTKMNVDKWIHSNS